MRKLSNNSIQYSRHYGLVKLLSLFIENSLEDMKREREEKKRYLLRKLSFRPTVEELKCRKVNTFIFIRPILFKILI